MQQYQMEFNEKKEPNLEDNVHEASSLIKVFLSLSIVCVCICICTCLLRLCASLNACSAGTTISQGSSSALSQRVSSTAAPPVRRPPPLPSPYHCHCPFRPHLLSACAEEQARMLPLHLPPLHRNLFFWLIDLLVRVVEYKDSNKMDHTNLGKYCDRSIDRRGSAVPLPAPAPILVRPHPRQRSFSDPFSAMPSIQCKPSCKLLRY